MVKRSIEQEIRNKNVGSRNGKFEKNAVVKNQGPKQRVQRILGDCWQWETNGQCVKGDNCSFRHDTSKRGKVTPSNPTPNSFMQQRVSENHREPEVPEAGAPVEECLDGLARISLEELVITHVVKSGTLWNACSTRPRVVADFGEKCSYSHRQVDEQPTKRSKKNDDKSAVAMLKKGNWQEREPVTDECHDRPGKPGNRSDEKLGQNSSKRQSSDTAIGLCISGHDAAEVYSRERHRHAETNPTCETHVSYCTSH